MLSVRRNSRGSPMNVKIAMLVTAFGGACLVTSALALPVVNVPGDTTATQVRDDDAGDIAGKVIRGLGGHNNHRDRDYDRRRDRDRHHDRHHDRDRDYHRHHDWDR